ncbi:MAG: DUF1573 domain-containing protein [Candidatus Cryptobacteroides sp.]
MNIRTLPSIFASVLILLSLPASLLAQGSGKDNVFGGVVQLDRTIHDFGDILVSDGPVHAVFTVRNVSSEPIVIFNVVSSCGCTDVEWTRQPVRPGETGTIKATYKNDEGAYPFDKILTAYFSGVKQPVVLHLRGESHAKKVPLSEMYPARFGNLGIKSVDIKGGNLSQGQQKSGEVNVANLGQKPLKVTFKDVSEGLSLSVSPNPVPAGATASLSYTVTSDRDHWGKNYYYATPLVDGKAYKAQVTAPAAPKSAVETVKEEPNPLLGTGSEKIGIFTITKEDFSSWTKEEKDRGSQPVADGSTFELGKVKKGSRVEAVFGISNRGKSPLVFYKVDCDNSRAAAAPFGELQPGARRELKVTIDTAGMPSGELLVVLTLITNSPIRPIMNLYVTGWVE